MSSIAPAIFSALSSDAGVSALVRSPDGEIRIFPNLLRQSVDLPAIVFTVVSDTPMNVIDGNAPTLRRARVQIDCYALHLDEAEVVADAVEVLLRSYTKQEMTASQLDRMDDWDDLSLHHRVRMDFAVWRNV